MKNSIRVERAKKRISQAMLAKETDLSFQSINKIENNKQDPKVSAAMKIAKAFGLDVEQLFEEE